MSKPDSCTRCGAHTSQLYKHEHENDDEKVVDWLCWDCDFDIANGRGDYGDDPTDVVMRHWEEAYSYDPINTPAPPGYA